jgi:hypothetical protein
LSTSQNLEVRGRNHWMLPLGIVTAIVMMALWFPASALWHQQGQLDTTAAQIQAIQRQEQAIKTQAKTIDTKAAATELAREQYQLVAPGQSLIQVLPGDSAGQVSANSVDPGFQPLVSPSTAAPIESTTTATTSTHSSVDNYVSRLVRTLEFWH